MLHGECVIRQAPSEIAKHANTRRTARVRPDAAISRPPAQPAIDAWVAAAEPTSMPKPRCAGRRVASSVDVGEQRRTLIGRRLATRDTSRTRPITIR
jgi:hypothetical protein